LAKDKQGLSSGIRPIRRLFQIDFPHLAQHRADRGGTSGVPEGSPSSLPSFAVKVASATSSVAMMMLTAVSQGTPAADPSYEFKGSS
jgi:hypothetical protein